MGSYRSFQKLNLKMLYIKQKKNNYLNILKLHTAYVNKSS
jgi:hypothetical protein